MKKLFTVLLVLVLALFTFSACSSEDTAAAPAQTEAPTETTAPEAPADDEDDQTLRIVSLAPSNTEILVDLGFGDALVGVDTWSADITGLPADLALFDFMALDAEELIALAPDFVFTHGISFVDGADPLSALSEVGIAVVHIPSSTSIAEIKSSIAVIANALDASAAGDLMISEMEEAIAEIQAIAETIEDPLRVYFEISPAPYMFTTGNGSFLHEMIELVGAVNVFAGEDSWFQVADEAILAENPDVILTNVDFLPDPLDEIVGRPGWDALSAVQEGRLHEIPQNFSSRANHNIVHALWAMALAIYPQYFA